MSRLSLPGHDAVGLRADNPGPFTLAGTNTWIYGRDPAWLIDPGPALPEHLDAISEELDERGGLGAVLLTHDHIDHAAGRARDRPALFASAARRCSRLGLRPARGRGSRRAVRGGRHPGARARSSGLRRRRGRLHRRRCARRGQRVCHGPARRVSGRAAATAGLRALVDRPRTRAGGGGPRGQAGPVHRPPPGPRDGAGHRAGRGQAHDAAICSTRSGRTRRPICGRPQRSRSKRTCRSSSQRAGFPRAWSAGGEDRFEPGRRFSVPAVGLVVAEAHGRDPGLGHDVRHASPVLLKRRLPVVAVRKPCRQAPRSARGLESRRPLARRRRGR